MYRTLTLVVLWTLWLFGGVPAQAEEKKLTATFQDFQEWGKRLEGRWISKITFIDKWPGQDKKQGEVVTGHATYRWLADKHGLEEVNIAGNSESRTLHYWDAAARQIKLVIVGSEGTTWVVSMGRKGDKWPWIAKGSLHDGTKVEGEGEDTLTADGNFFVAGRVFKGGKELPKLHDVYKKLSK